MSTSKLHADSAEETVQSLFAEFNETLRSTGTADYAVLKRCPAELREELQSLMNVATLTYRAFHPPAKENAEHPQAAMR